MMKKQMFVAIGFMILFVSCTSFVFADYLESPMLKDSIENGEIPPVEDRLPKQPAVIDAKLAYELYGIEDFSIGSYSEEMYLAHDREFTEEAISDSRAPFNVKDYEVTPHFFKDYEVEDDGKVWTIYMREGVKWSDGESCTAEDIEFWFNNVIKNDELTPVSPDWLKKGEEVVKFEKLDKYSFKFVFQDANPMFIYEWANNYGEEMLTTPKHYLKDFHPDFVSKDELEEKVEEGDFESWVQLYENKANHLERPVLGAFIMVQGPPDEPTIIERNPYYWAVDEKGQQLPYFDKIVGHDELDQEVVNLRAMGGEVDYARVSFELLPELRRMEEDTEEISVHHEIRPMTNNALSIVFNLNYQDSELKEIFRNPKFRKAVSYAIDREEISQFVTFGLSEPRQTAPTTLSPFYKEEYEKAYIKYDPEKAKKMLDEIGLNEKNSEGYRMTSEGEALNITYVGYDTSHFGTVMELVVEQLREVGLNGNMKDMGFHALDNYEANEHMAGFWQTWGSHSGLLLAGAPEFVPMSNTQHPFAPLWASWYNTNGEGGEEPTEEIKTLFNWYDQACSTLDADVQNEYMEKVLDHSILENLYTIGVMDPPGAILVTSTEFRNAPAERSLLWLHGFPLYYMED